MKTYHFPLESNGCDCGFLKSALYALEKGGKSSFLANPVNCKIAQFLSVQTTEPSSALYTYSAVAVITPGC